MAEAECHVAVPPVPDPEAAPEYSDEEIALWMDTASDEEVLAFTRQGGWQQQRARRFGGGKKGGGKGNKGFGGKGGAPRFAGNFNTPPRTARDMTCVTCGEKGHHAGQCSKPQVSPDQRPCFVCKKPG